VLAAITRNQEVKDFAEAKFYCLYATDDGN